MADGEVAVTGTVDNQPVPALGGFGLFSIGLGDNGWTSDNLVVDLSTSLTCAAYKAGMHHENETALAFALETQAPFAIPIASGTSWSVGDNSQKLTDAGDAGQGFAYMQVTYSVSANGCTATQLIEE